MTFKRLRSISKYQLDGNHNVFERKMDNWKLTDRQKNSALLIDLSPVRKASFNQQEE